MAPTQVPASDFPETIAVIQALGATDAERAKALNFKNAKTVERLRRFIPSTLLVRLLDSPHAAVVLQAMLSDVERRQTPPS